MNQELPITGEQEMELGECRAAGADFARSIPFEGRRVAHADRRAKHPYVKRILAQRAAQGIPCGCSMRTCA